MRSRPFRCDTGRLRSFLDDRLDEPERAGLADHLETCPSCQRALERLAAGSGLWRSLGQLAGTRPATPPPGGPRGPGATARPDQADDDEAIGFLAPPSGPGHLGLLGPYEITAVLGRGGMGVVLRAYDPALARVVAIKVLAPQLATSGAARKRFAREARAAAAVAHEHVIAIHAVESWNGLPYLVMPYIAGRSLQERIDRDGPLEVKEVLRIGMQAARGLAAAHAQGLVHRDVKPSNILLENGVERVWLTDFGLARAADDASLTQSGVVAGTPQYMAPEQARGETIDHRADLFSLGSVLYAMCAGHPPFRAGTTLAILRRVSDERPRSLVEVDPEVPAWLSALVEKLHARDPADRYQTAEEVAEVLGRRLAELQRPSVRPAHKAPEAAPRPGGRSTRGRPASLFAAALVLLVALGTAEFAGLTRLANSLMLAPQARDPGAGGEPGARAGEPAGPIAAAKGDEDGPIVGSGKPATKDFAVADFENVEVVHPFRVELVRADDFGITVTADDNVLGHVQVVKEGSTLKIALEEGKSYRLKADSLTAKIGMPALAGIGLSHGARATVRGFRSDRALKARAAHGSVLEGEVEAGDVVLDASHGSEIALKGRARDGRLVVSHGSRLLLGDLALRAIGLDAEHGSTARVDARSREAFKARAAHGCTLTGSVEAGDVTIKAEHGSQASLKGSARKADLEASHGCRLALGGLALDGARVYLGQGSSATVNARDALDYRLDHASSLRYVGHPKVTRSESNRSSSVRSIGADEAAREQLATPEEPAARARPARGDIEITPHAGGPGSIRIGDRAAGTIVGSGKAATRGVDVGDFKTVEARCPCTIEVTRGDAFRVSLSADDNVLEHLKAIKEVSTLKITLDDGNYRTREPLKATVTMPAIEGVTFGGAARAKIQGFDSDRPFRARLGGAARLDGSIRAGEVTLDADGASHASLGGAAPGVTLKASGASRVDLNDLAAGTADVTLAGASRATVNARERLGYSVTGVSNLEYSGDPAIGRSAKDGMSKVSRRR